MKIAIIGAGNMGGAMARGLAKGTVVAEEDIWVSNPTSPKLEALKAFHPGIHTTTDNQEAVDAADWIILAVKPWLLESVVNALRFRPSQVIISVVAGVAFDRLAAMLGNDRTLFRMIPNTAISEQASMNLISARNASKEQEGFILSLFNELGLTMIIPETQLNAAMILTSCGIAYVLKYIHAATEAGVEMGIAPRTALKMVAQSVKGAAELILRNDTHPAVEIDKVTTPGGITVKGLNELEHAGFSSAVIRAMKACL
ncbi:MAG: pyrroline-5-carboxylate reductase [Porphyromonadaceae bacterium]|nr:pyrroline-5-carboxylate reductase [Porphyromonadaceae bacterium]